MHDGAMVCSGSIPMVADMNADLDVEMLMDWQSSNGHVRSRRQMHDRDRSCLTVDFLDGC